MAIPPLISVVVTRELLVASAVCCPCVVAGFNNQFCPRVLPQTVCGALPAPAKPAPGPGHGLTDDILAFFIGHVAGHPIGPIGPVTASFRGPQAWAMLDQQLRSESS